MEKLSSPVRVPSAITAPPSASKQTAYTTAGTPWNRQTSQPLQAPARRGRSLKWTGGGSHSDLSLFPKSVIASLPLRGNPGRAPSHQTYSPLQQNYDRAVSPFGDRDHQAADISPQILQMRSGNAPAALASLMPRLNKDGIAEENSIQVDDEVDDDDDNDDDYDSDFNMNPLRNMTVKSLNNLASYPNPNQKRAQKALYGRIKPSMISQVSATRIGVPASPAAPQRVFNSPGTVGNGRGLTPVPFTAESESPLLRSGQTDAGARPEVHHGVDGQVGARAVDANRPSLLLSTGTRISGSGTPRPLTAGPPGQRQYRPSTFESTFRALQNKSSGDIGGKEDEDRVSIARQIMYQAGIDDTEPATDTFSSPLGIYVPTGTESTKPLSISPFQQPTPTLTISSNDGGHSAQMSAPNFLMYEGYDPEFTRLQYSIRFHSGAYESAKPAHLFGNVGHFKPGTDRLSDAALLHRKERIDRYWYEGTDMLGKTSSDVLAESELRKAAQKLGAIGDGRPQKPRTEYSHITIDDANRMSRAEHAEPLVNMVYAALLYHKDNGGLERYQSQKPTMDEAK